MKRPYENTSEEYCMYLRKSRMDLEAEARGEGDTLARHRQILLELAQRLSLPIAHIYHEVVSGETIAARPQMQQLLADVEQGRWKGVLCMEVERLARGNTSDQGLVADTFKYSNTKIITPMKIYDPSDEFDEEFFEFGLFRSRMEYKAINRRLQRGRQASLDEGKYIAGKAPYGYERYKLPRQKGYSLRVVPEQAEVVRRIFSWYADGELRPDGSSAPLGAAAIAKRLNSQGIPSPSGGAWPACTIAAMLKNPVYIGKVRWSHRPTVKLMVKGARVTTRPVDNNAPVLDGLHEPIIDQALWDRVQALLSQRGKVPVPKCADLQNPLSGLVFCAQCGHSLVRRKYRHGRDMLACPTPGCSCKAAVLEEVEQAVLDSLSGWLSHYRIAVPPSPILTQHQAELEKEVARLEQLLSRLENQADNLHNLVELGVYTHDVFLERSQALSRRIETVSQALADSQSRLWAHQIIAKRQQDLVSDMEEVLSVYPTLATAQEKNDLLKEIVAYIVYSKTRGSRWEKSDLKLFLFPRLAAKSAQTSL